MSQQAAIQKERETKSIKCVIWDLDNTLWDGTLIEDKQVHLREHVVDDVDLLDGGMIFGTGFAPFRGGPLHYIKTTGEDTLLQRLHRLEQQLGPRFKPDAGWEYVSGFTSDK